MSEPYTNRVFTLFHADDSRYAAEGLGAGFSLPQPPGVGCREVRHPDDLERLEIVSPARFGTRNAEAP